MKILLIYLLSAVYFFLSFSLQTMRAIGIYLIISVGLFFWANMEWKRSFDKRNDEIRRISEEWLEEIPHTQFILSPNCLNSLLINEVTNILYLAQRESLEVEFDIEDIPFHKILEVAIVEDESILSLYPKGGLLGDSLKDRDLEYEGDSEEEFDEDEEEEDEEDEEDETITKLSLKILVDDLTNPIIEYIFIENEDSLAIDSEKYMEAIKLCNDWYQKLSIIIKRYEHDKVLVRKWQ